MADATPERIVVGEQFALIAKHGVNDQGTSWLASYAAGSCLVTVKLPTTEDAPRGVPATARFVARCEAFLSIRHPALAQGFTHGVGADGTPYLVTEYVEGISLPTFRYQRGGPLSPREAARLLLPVVDGLCCCHAEGIHHGAIAVSDIRVCTDNPHSMHVMLVDFGTPWLDGEVVSDGASVDLYAIGRALAFLTCGDGPLGPFLDIDPHPPVHADADWQRLLRSITGFDPAEEGPPDIASMRGLRRMLESVVDQEDEGTVRRPFWDEPLSAGFDLGANDDLGTLAPAAGAPSRPTRQTAVEAAGLARWGVSAAVVLLAFALGMLVSGCSGGAHGV